VAHHLRTALAEDKKMKEIIRKRADAGFTLVELMVAMVMLSIVSTATFYFYIGQHQAYVTQSDVSDMQQNGRAAVRELSYHLRQAGFSPPVDSSAFTIFAVGGGPDSITINHHDTSYTFFVDATDSLNPILMRRVNSDSAVIFAEDIDSLTFTQVSANEVSIVLVAKTRRVDSALGDYRRRRLTTLVNIRNL
jgi:prepilin-type N-terminal cleavage/methylation domain-containing protein